MLSLPPGEIPNAFLIRTRVADLNTWHEETTVHKLANTRFCNTFCSLGPLRFNRPDPVENNEFIKCFILAQNEERMLRCFINENEF